MGSRPAKQQASQESVQPLLLPEDGAVAKPKRTAAAKRVHLRRPRATLRLRPRRARPRRRDCCKSRGRDHSVHGCRKGRDLEGRAGGAASCTQGEARDFHIEVGAGEAAAPKAAAAKSRPASTEPPCFLRRRPALQRNLRPLRRRVLRQRQRPPNRSPLPRPPPRPRPAPAPATPTGKAKPAAAGQPPLRDRPPLRQNRRRRPRRLLRPMPLGHVFFDRSDLPCVMPAPKAQQDAAPTPPAPKPESTSKPAAKKKTTKPAE